MVISWDCGELEDWFWNQSIYTRIQQQRLVATQDPNSSDFAGHMYHETRI